MACIFLLTCGVIISRTHFTTDLSAFLPRSPTPEQQLLMDQLRDGLASRLILVGIEGADAPTRARLSKQVAQRLRADRNFVSVNNGEPVNAERDRVFLFSNRYLLSPAVTPARFSVDGLHAALGDSIDLLASPAGLLVKSILPRDPTGEMVQLLDQLNSGTQPRMVEGAWASRDGTRALMLMQTRAAGSDTDAQQHAMAAISQAFEQAAGATPSARLVMTGPGVFSVTSRDTIKSEVTRLSIISVALIATLLLLVYRSFSALTLGLVARDQRGAGRHRGGQPGIWGGARHHPGIWHCADRRSSGLFNLPVCAIGTERCGSSKPGSSAFGPPSASGC